MLYEYLGGEHGLFFKRIKKLLKYKFKNANTQQLFHELGGNKIINMMNSWVKQPGLPLIKIECNIVNKNKLRFILTQERIRPKIGSGERISNEQVWEIPIKILDSSGVHNDLDLMRDTSVEFELDRIDFFYWIFFFYVVCVFRFRIFIFNI